MPEPGFLSKPRRPRAALRVAPVVLSLATVLALPGLGSAQEEQKPSLKPKDLVRQLESARRAHQDGPLAEVQEVLLEAASRSPDDGALQLALAESYLYRADLLRNERSVRDLESRVAKRHRKQQGKWGKAGMRHAERALALARSEAETAQAERVTGELYVHQISGPITGMRFGPRALKNIRQALARAPEDPECNRAIGLMYLYNPPINGGDVDLAIRTFRKCTELDPKNDIYPLFLSLAFRKKENFVRAELAAKQALRLNPRNVAASSLVEEYEARKKKEEAGS